MSNNAFGIQIETKNFNKHIRSFLRGTSVNIDKAIKKFAFDLLKRVIMKTPV